MDTPRYPITIEGIQKLIKEYFSSIDTTQEIVDAHLHHAYRYLISMNYIVSQNICSQGLVIFEAGGKGVFTYLLNNVLSFYNIVHFSGDLREEINFDANSIDNILCMEVIEHIADDKKYHEMRFEGVKLMLKHFWHILKPNGRILLTTPNITSYASLLRILKNKNPMQYNIHVREYSCEEILLIANKLCFNVDFISTEFVFVQRSRYKILRFIMSLFNLNHINRGDTIFAILRKPDSSIFEGEDIDLAHHILQLN